MSLQPIIQINKLSIQANNNTLLYIESLCCNAGEIHSIIGESGSGKSLTLLTIIGLLPKNLIVSGEVLLWHNNTFIDLLKLSNKDFQAYRGKLIGMVFQEPMSALNPQMTCGKQLLESYLVHGTKNEAIKLITEKLDKVGLGQMIDRVMESFPHQLSGGQRQRVMIAMASLHNPLVLLADEPTTALDSFSRNQVMEDFTRLAKEMNCALIWVSHELDLVAKFANQITVLKKGELIEQGNANSLINNPQHPYVVELLEAVPKPKEQRNIPQNHVLIVKNVFKYYGKGKNQVNALNNYSVSLSPGETLAVIGTSGSGKSTLAKLLVALEKSSSGEIQLHGNNIPSKPPTGIQMVFQDPFASLNRNHTAVYAVSEIIELKNPEIKEIEINQRALKVLNDVGFDERLMNAKPDQMSGGQRQRLCIAKALCTNPEVLILDEAVAALDPLIQKQILDLLRDIQLARQLIYIFITHNLDVAKSLADKWCYLDGGVEKEIPAEWLIQG